ncbi:WD40-repeat-containing domain protein [Dimargaris cristalligena]|uniref:WD40-repeat-containing domain protein n=1 Tax=Dimargaris cristalligena TaxID=215637 RepID=A0A4P9ZMW4_9FUNG|nr:WD40-repeat-containing domain protein [Dimargaris cristalligena]|eukprot:RKP34485.1 WD40-repeat-containing domain protein [Dimargaris cristalligena]
MKYRGGASFVVTEAHEGEILDLDYNPNRPQQLATCGEDCKVRIWDLRNLSQPLMMMADHTHWVWAVAYNHFHDQLLLTSSSDCTVNLESIVSVSSASLIKRDSDDGDSDVEQGGDPEYRQYAHQDNGSFERPTDGLVATFDQHEESLYSVSWSEANPWVFASLSYDGRVVVNFVPQEEKYKIIL